MFVQTDCIREIKSKRDWVTSKDTWLTQKALAVDVQSFIKNKLIVYGAAVNFDYLGIFSSYFWFVFTLRLIFLIQYIIWKIIYKSIYLLHENKSNLIKYPILLLIKTQNWTKVFIFWNKQRIVGYLQTYFAFF